MFKSEKKLRKIYLALMIFIYGIFTPITVYEWLFTDGGFPLTAVIVGVALPFMRKNHLNQVREKEGKEPV
ncbi:hypothetical protein J2Z83_003580 [Virgibacillus natechei]|uniref:Uncharacterized protein n=1 Tax=Virgibacillus natechei TaxID=1216297 RepID=A0ABS4ILZ6_9BACI|nr:hypothetical protein [Virgibacillus natechei]MBP1971441.1 hypothetical protein [Virgibacillus natechei]UZD13811.1 hypothetical protein OLD84_04465 [Virgibacillus natechei]